MTTGRINQVTILKTKAKHNTCPRPLALQRVRSNSRKFQIDMKLQRHRSQGSSARCAAHWTYASYSPPRSFPSCISLRAADLARQSRCRESPRSERTFGGCFLPHSHAESGGRQSPSSGLYTISQCEPIHAFILYAQRQPRLVRMEFERARLGPGRSKPAVAQKS